MKKINQECINLDQNVPVIVDFYCGAGGFTRGALDAGAYVASGIDIDFRARETYEYNNKNTNGCSVLFIKKRIEDLTKKNLRDILKPFKNQPLVFVGCPPCQPFTNLGTDKTGSQGSKETLTAFINHVLYFKPRFIAVENVPGIRAPKYGKIWEKSVSRLKNTGYQVRDEIIDAKRFGVPQTRRRMFLIAAYNESPPWPVESHGAKRYQKVRDALSGKGLRRLAAGKKDPSDPMHFAARLSEKNIERIKATPKSGGSRTSWPPHLQLDCYKKFTGYTDVYGRMDWKKPAPTLTTRFNSLSNGRFGHPTQNRAITPREGSLLQTFPRDFQFLAPSINANVCHIGNAVPPLLAKAIILAIKVAIEEKPEKTEDKTGGKFQD